MKYENCDVSTDRYNGMQNGLATLLIDQEFNLVDNSFAIMCYRTAIAEYIDCNEW